jgi:hypothetical protein
MPVCGLLMPRSALEPEPRDEHRAAGHHETREHRSREFRPGESRGHQ